MCVFLAPFQGGWLMASQGKWYALALCAAQAHALSPAATRSAALAKAGWCSSNPVAGDIPCRAAKVCAAEEVISTDSACKDILQHAISHLNPSHKNCPTLQFQSCWTQFCILGTRLMSVVLAVGFSAARRSDCFESSGLAGN